MYAECPDGISINLLNSTQLNYIRHSANKYAIGHLQKKNMDIWQWQIYKVHIHIHLTLITKMLFVIGQRN